MADQPKVLIVEDDFFIRDLYESQLKISGFDVSIAGDGQEGLQKTQEVRPDIVLLDIMLPKMNGLDVLKAIKKDQGLANTRVLMLTNLGQETVIKEGFSQGADGYLIKSEYTPSQIVAEIKTLLGIQS